MSVLYSLAGFYVTDQQNDFLEVCQLHFKSEQRLEGFFSFVNASDFNSDLVLLLQVNQVQKDHLKEDNIQGRSLHINLFVFKCPCKTHVHFQKLQSSS